MPVCTVDLVIFNKYFNKILLFKRNNAPAKDLYYTAGGRLHKNETLEKCAIRQAKEELGLNIKKRDMAYGGVVEEIFNNSYFSEDIGTHNINFYFSTILDENKAIKLDDQHTESKWFSINDKKIHKWIKERILFTLTK